MGYLHTLDVKYKTTAAGRAILAEKGRAIPNTEWCSVRLSKEDVYIITVLLLPDHDFHDAIETGGTFRILTPYCSTKFDYSEDTIVFTQKARHEAVTINKSYVEA